MACLQFLCSHLKLQIVASFAYTFIVHVKDKKSLDDFSIVSAMNHDLLLAGQLQAVIEGHSHSHSRI